MLLSLAISLALILSACGQRDPLPSSWDPGTAPKAKTETESPSPAASDCPPPDSTSAQAATDPFEGLRVAPEHRCSGYDRNDYRYPQSVELSIIQRDGLVSRYTGRRFQDRSESDIEHIVALSEAHDSGMCARPNTAKRAFSSDLLNLALAAPRLNRYEKKAKDAADWLPPLNRCWFVQTVIAVKKKYQLTVDEREFQALKAVVDSCAQQ